jgi:hypothetical protein
LPLIKSSGKKALQKNIKTEIEANPSKDKRDQDIAIAYSVQRQARKKKMAKGGPVEYGKGPEATQEPGMPQPKPDDRRIAPIQYMSAHATDGDAAPPHKPDNQRLPMDEYMANHFALGGTVQSLDPEQAKHLARHLMSMHSMEPEGTHTTNEPGVPGRHPDDQRPAESEIMSGDFTDGSGAPSRKPDDMRPPKDRYMRVYAAEGGKVKGPMNPKLSESVKEGMEGMSRMSPAEAIMKKRKMAEGGYIDLNPPRDEGDEYYDNQNGKASMKELYTDDDLDSDPWDSNEDGDAREDDEENKLDMVEKIRRKERLKANKD